MENLWKVRGILAEYIYEICSMYGVCEPVYGICVEYVWNVYGTCMGHVWNMYEIYEAHV